MPRIETKMGEELVAQAARADEVLPQLERQRLTVVRLRALCADAPSDEQLQADLGRGLGRLSELARLVGRFDEAREAREESVEIWRRLGRDKACVLGELQSTLLLHLEGDHHGAQARFDLLQTMVELPEFEVYRDFYLEYRGTAFAREGLKDKAKECLERALELRRERGNPRQIEETELLIARITAD